MSENTRLKEIRKTLGLTQRQISETLEIKQGSYSDVERGKSGISAILLKNLIRKFRINPIWLCDGEGGMFVDLDYSTVNEPINKMKEDPVPEPKGKKIAFKKESFDEQLMMLDHEREYLENIKSVVTFLKKEE